jgi:hypothetical protein
MTPSSLLFGCFDTSVHEIAAALWKHLPAFNGALIRCLDSSRDAVAIAAVFKTAGIPMSISGAGAILGVKGLEHAICDPKLFCGFDEVWFLSSCAVEPTIPDTLSLTSDGGPITRAEAAQVGSLMEANKVPLVLADGCGVNCATFDVGFWNRTQAKWNRKG